MASTGQFLLLFLVGHAAGNATLWAGAINSYAAHLHALPTLVWLFRGVMVLLLGLHAWQGVTLWLENRRAGGGPYAVRVFQRATVSSRTMIWSGLTIAAFLLYHLLHLTIQVIHPEAAASAHLDAAGRPDVQRMLVSGLSHPGTAAVYAIGTIALGLHLLHGVASSVQTFGLNGSRSFPWLERLGIASALVVAAAFLVVPVAILAGLVQ